MKLISKPSVLGYKMPAEWASHEATWLAWPHNEKMWPGKRLGEVQEIYLQMFEALLPGEKVHLLVPGEKEQEAVESRLRRRGINSKNLIAHKIPSSDIWIRDYGPTFLTYGNKNVIASEAKQSGSKTQIASSPAAPRNDKGEKAWCKWNFNAWGGKYPELIKDTEIFRKENELIPYPCFESDLVLEGGSIEVNGEGTCLTTEQCLLNRSRNPRLSRQEIEESLKNYLGVSQIVWLAGGIEGDDTDGHVDDIARFVDPTTVVSVYEKDEADKNYSVLKKNWEILEKFRGQQKKRWDLVKLPMPGKIVEEGTPLPASYANFYIANQVVLLPVYKDSNDKEAVSILKELFPHRLVIPIPCRPLISGLGAIHCVTQQEPV